jgi:hypothetical protein
MPEHAEAVANLIAMLRRGYAPGWTPWTDLEATQAAAMSAEWMDALSPFGADVLAVAFTRHIEGEEGERHPSLIAVLRLAQEVARERATSGGPAASATCDGSGWLAPGEPCPSCAPALYDLSLDAGLWDAYVRGTHLSVLHPGVEALRGGGTRLRDRVTPRPCLPHPVDAAFPVARVMAAARAEVVAWVAEFPPRARTGDRGYDLAVARAHAADRAAVGEAAVHRALEMLSTPPADTVPG